MNPNQKPERTVEVVLAQDVTAYTRATVTVPAGVDLETYLRDQVDEIASDHVFRPDWDTAEGLTIVDATSSDGEVLTDIDVVPRPMGTAYQAEALIRKHWRRLATSLPPDVVAEFRSLLKGDVPCVNVAQLDVPTRLIVGTIEDVRKDVENGVVYLRSIVEEPVLLQYGADVKIEVRPDNDTDRVAVYHATLGETVVDYDQRRAPALQVTVFQGGHSIDPLQSFTLSRAALEAETAGLKAGPLEA